MVGIRPRVQNKCTCAEYPALQQDLEDAFRQKKAPFFTADGKEECSFEKEKIFWKQVGIADLEVELAVSSTTGKCAVVCSCPDEFMEEAKDVIKKHNQKDNLHKVA
eukprot:863336-Pyramimonas_sp.AAC.1